MWRLSRRLLLAFATASVMATSCISPTLPLPPPEVPEITQVGAEQYRLQGTLPVEGSVIVQDARTSLIYGQANVTSYDLVISARDGDSIVFWYDVGNSASDTTIFQIETAPGETLPLDGGRDAGADR